MDLGVRSGNRSFLKFRGLKVAECRFAGTAPILLRDNAQ